MAHERTPNHLSKANHATPWAIFMRIMEINLSLLIIVLIILKMRVKSTFDSCLDLIKVKHDNLVKSRIFPFFWIPPSRE